MRPREGSTPKKGGGGVCFHRAAAVVVILPTANRTKAHNISTPRHLSHRLAESHQHQFEACRLGRGLMKDPGGKNYLSYSYFKVSFVTVMDGN